MGPGPRSRNGTVLGSMGSALVIIHWGRGYLPRETLSSESSTGVSPVRFNRSLDDLVVSVLRDVFWVDD